MDSWQTNLWFMLRCYDPLILSIRFLSYTFTGLNKNFDHMDLDIDLLIFKINVQPLSCDFQKQNPFPFLNPDIYDIRNPA